MQESSRQEIGNRQPTIQAIKAGLDGQRLLGDLAASYLLRPTDYVVSTAADGRARIRHRDEKIHYNVSDFLTKHVHLSWGETQPYLVAAFDRQQQNVPRRKIAAAVEQDLHAAFSAERRTDMADVEERVARDRVRQSERELERKSAINDHFIQEKARILADRTLSGPARKAARSIAAMDKGEAHRILSEEIGQERAALKHEHSSAQQYPVWLQRKAQAGDQEALAELRRQSTALNNKELGFAAVLAAVEDQPDAGKLLEQEERGNKKLLYSIAQNGDVTYWRQGRELILDTSRAVYVIHSEDDTIEQALRLAS
ncbi:MAG: hypothetical protein NVSMB6_01790 [Burkholderiaceae bacterium]